MPEMSSKEARELATVARTLKDERTHRTLSPQGVANPDDTALALARMQSHFEQLAEEAEEHGA